MSEEQLARLVRTSTCCTESQWDALSHSFIKPYGGSGRCGAAVVPASPQWEGWKPSVVGGRTAGTRPHL
eukprot:5394634-Pyramimonas_sp.AAC.1